MRKCCKLEYGSSSCANDFLKKLAHLTTKNFKHQLATSLVRKQQTTTT
jgi:hypothetical protein